jgi:hypothetical protein
MKGIRYILISAVALGVVGLSAAAGPVALTSAGDLYRVAQRDNQVVVTARYADGALSELAIPQSANAAADSLQVGFDEATGALYVLWQRKTGMDAKLRLATYIDGTWIGPKTIAGNDGAAAYNPQLLIDRAVSSITEEAGDDEAPVVTELATTFLHIVWWRQNSEDDIGVARYAAVAVDDEGMPQIDDMSPVDLIDLIPYGITCFDIGVGDNLKHPKLFIDPKTGNPHLFTTDLSSCIFEILELRPEVVVDATGADKRRRHIIILRQGATIALRPDLPFAKGRLEVGGSRKLIMHWDDDEDNVLHYLELDQEGVSDTKSLPLDETLSHEDAVDLIRGLTN